MVRIKNLKVCFLRSYDRAS